MGLRGGIGRLRHLGWRVKTRCVREIGSVVGTTVRVATAEPVIALTFDDGPDPEFTPCLLDVLASHGASATFFCLGKSAAENPEIVRRAAREGHTIGNHSWDHPSFAHISHRERVGQLRRCASILGSHEMTFFRPPYGDQTPVSQLHVRLLGYRDIGWSVAGYDWLDHPGDWIADRLVEQTGPGDIVLLHDRLYNAPDSAYFDRSPMLEAVEALLGVLSDYRFVTVPELLQLGDPVRELRYWKADPEWLGALETLETADSIA